MFFSVVFLLVEGTLLAFGTCILISALFFATIAALGISGAFWIAGFLVSNWRHWANELAGYVDAHLNKNLDLNLNEKKSS